ncbi:MULTISPECIES: iron-siderophore ABC transporter substrate-binding protein [unclassified Arthrobacter]|uniref:iron-siderophore ABC transporter substrate-binding protein n=1 Tax=unclassified Arthrobacter TaxID=235627 RepID=UPI001E2F5E5E|nr:MULTISPECIES: iron-siderophore ABC transporter substrate-binding protein [unclassified Arthrobacter]MCC9144615.1 iron-siderophore ABC transporter substrate-binding protein [Arthrobacter sp. zg-Y919]MDK1275841.1 iron-siderophore ABC transporter substrate-binding protein [Arthrobacter sp. zg.Y919]MDM7991473.1 iron-siderophore ABC transporter substrate-binding protein [Arthrobacter sp. zg-Y877]WIB02796.1 iron-siderophore ABC transporter substrate-binding protein [Arthrobacter sp. zg-Y919]
MALSRMRRAAAAAAVAVLSLSACSTGAAGENESSSSAAAAEDQFPVTIEHAFGETTIEGVPERVAAVSWANAETALALGVVPVGMPLIEFGGNEQGTTPWIDDALEDLDAPIGSENAPAQYSEADGIAFDDVAATNPDVIIAAYSGLSQEDYDKLSKIAPVVAYPEAPWGTSWQDTATMIGEALGKSDDAEKLVADTEQAITDKAAEYPQLEGKTFIYGNLAPGAENSVYTALDNRPKFMESLGLTQAPVVAENSKEGEFYVPWSDENLNQLDSDIFVSWVASDDVADTIASDPLLSQIPAVKNGSLVADADPTRVFSTSAINVLSIPYALDNVVPMIADAATAADNAK